MTFNFMTFYHGNQAVFLATRPCCPANQSLDRSSTVARVAAHISHYDLVSSTVTGGFGGPSAFSTAVIALTV